MEEQTVYAAGVTQEMIEQWKREFGSVHEITVPLDDDGQKFARGYFRKPDLKIISAAAKVAEIDPIKSGIVIFDNCLLGGDSELKTNDEAKMSAIEKVNELFVIRQASIKNL